MLCFRTSASIITLVRSTEKEGEDNTFLLNIAVLKENPVKKTGTGKKNFDWIIQSVLELGGALTAKDLFHQCELIP